ncbi:MAG: sugar MFS transporter [Acidobacterium ailaaui]|jgi:FHS family L-fucose permease-like MFS transporter|nr:sugar MFS transporter [Pseudacidobacterium ailaaui]
MAITNVNKSSMSTIASPGGTNKSAMAMVTTLFFVWGFLTSLNDILIPHLKSIFSLNYAEAMLVQFAFFCSYAAFGIPSGKVVEWIGYQRTMVAGLFTMCAGALLFIPAASVPSFALFLTALIVLAAGITALQVAANPYVSVLGPSETASSRLNLTQAFNSLGTVIGPLLGGWLILRGAKVLDTSGFSPEQLRAYRIHEAATVKFPYFAIALALVVLGLAIALYRFPRIDATRDYRPMGEKKDSIWRHRHVVLGAVAIFVYVGAEVSIGSFLINYFNQPEIGGLSALAASALVPFYWGGAMVGRFIGSAILQKMQTGRLLGLCAMVASVLVVVSMLTLGHVAIWSILLVGLFNSIMFPSIFTLGIAEMGPLTGEASGLLVTAIVGGALIPEVQGVLADRIGIHHAFVLPVLCYLFIAYYGFSGSRVIAAES